MAKFEMPFDVGAVIEEAMSLKNAKETPVSVSVYIDDSADDDLIAFTRSSYASAAANARISIAYLTNTEFLVNGNDDFAVIVAGRDMRVGEKAQELREAGVPVMVVTKSPNLVKKVAEEREHPIPEGDIVAPEVLSVRESEAAEIVANLPITTELRNRVEYEHADGEGGDADVADGAAEAVVEEVIAAPIQPAAAGAGAVGASAPASSATTDAPVANAAGVAVAAGAAAAGGAEATVAAGAEGTSASKAEAANADEGASAGSAARAASAVADGAATTEAGQQGGVLRATPARGLFGTLASVASAVGGSLRKSAAAAVAAAVVEQEPVNPFLVEVPEGLDAYIELNDEYTQWLSTRMGEWVIEACNAKRLSMALAFPFVRRPLANDTVNVTALQNAGIGVVLFIPGADMPIMTLNQAKMLLQIAAAYGEPMTLDRAKELAAVVAGAFACRTVAREVAGIVPGVGWAVKGSVAYAGTQAMGKAAIEYFESGAGVMGVAGLATKISDAVQSAVNFVVGEESAAEPEVPQDPLQKAGDYAKRAGKFATAAAGAAGPVAEAAAKVAAGSVVAGANNIADTLIKHLGKR